jgi:hypothetical protein
MSSQQDPSYWVQTLGTSQDPRTINACLQALETWLFEFRRQDRELHRLLPSLCALVFGKDDRL